MIACGCNGPASCGRYGGTGRRDSKRICRIWRILLRRPSWRRPAHHYPCDANGRAKPGEAVADSKKLTGSRQRPGPHLHAKSGGFIFGAIEPADALKSSRSPPRQDGTACPGSSARRWIMGRSRWPISPMRRRLRPRASATATICSGYTRAPDCHPKANRDPVSLPDSIFLNRIPIIDYARSNGERVDRSSRHVRLRRDRPPFRFLRCGHGLDRGRRMNCRASLSLTARCPRHALRHLAAPATSAAWRS